MGIVFRHLSAVTSSVSLRSTASPRRGKPRGGRLSMHGCTHLICRLWRHLLACGLGHGSALDVHRTSVHYRTALRAPRRGRNFGHQSILQRSAKNALQIQTWVAWRTEALHLPSAGRALPARGEFSRRGACDPESKIHSSRILRPKISAEILAKSANPKIPQGMNSLRNFCRFEEIARFIRIEGVSLSRFPAPCQSRSIFGGTGR